MDPSVYLNSCRPATMCPGWTVVESVTKSPTPAHFFLIKKEGGKEKGGHNLMRAGWTPLFT